MNMTMRGSSLWYSTVICNILIYITYDIQHDLSPWDLGHGTKSFHCQKLNIIVFKFCHNNCFLFCKDENTSLKLNQMLSEPGLLPVPLSMLTESPPPHRARVTVSVTDHWPVSQISQLIFYLDHSVSSGHLGREYVSREKKLTMVNFLIFVQKNVSTIRFQEIKICPLKGFEKMCFLCFYIIGV